MSMRAYKMLDKLKIAIRASDNTAVLRLLAVPGLLNKVKNPLLHYVPCLVGKHKMFLDPKHRYFTDVLFYGGIHEPLETELIAQEIKNGDVVLDIGANIGYYTLKFADIVGEEGRVFAFEPDPNNFSYLKKNVNFNWYKNTNLIQKAVTNKSGKGKLHLSKKNLGDHRIYNSQDRRKVIEIDTIRLDDYFQHSNHRVDFIKLDAQGAELLIAEGMETLLRKNRKLKILTEYWPIGIKRSGRDPEDYLKLLINHGFQMYNINSLTNKIEPFNMAEILKVYTVKIGNFTDLFCVRI